MKTDRDVVTAEKFEHLTGGYVQINNLLVEVKRSLDKQGYIIDVFNNDTEDLLGTTTIWNEDLEVKE